MRYKKKTAALLVLAAICALNVVGCKKKEPVDLSSLHSTAAAKETMADTKAETTAAVVESEAKPAQNSSLNTELIKETIGKAVITYPAISNMKDTGLQEKANALLKANAGFIANIHADQEITIQAEVAALNLRRITVLYTGETKEGERIFFSNTVDLESIQNLGLRDFADPYTVAGYIASGEYKLSDIKGKESEIRSYLNQSDKTVEYYYSLLKHADFQGSFDGDAEDLQELPSVFSYEKQGVVYTSIPVSKELGSYVLIHYSPDNK